MKSGERGNDPDLPKVTGFDVGLRKVNRKVGFADILPKAGRKMKNLRKDRER
jgi:hypothetical protein